jgi:hypothetical protein
MIRYAEMPSPGEIRFIHFQFLHLFVVGYQRMISREKKIPASGALKVAAIPHEREDMPSGDKKHVLKQGYKPAEKDCTKTLPPRRLCWQTKEGKHSPEKDRRSVCLKDQKREADRFNIRR